MTHSSGLLGFIKTLLITLIALVALGYLLPYRIFSAIGSSSGQILEAYTKLARIDMAKLSARRNQQMLAENEQKIARVNTTFFSPENPLPLIEHLEALAKSAQVELKINLVQIPGSEFPDFQLLVSGVTPQIFSFLRMLENGDKVIVVSTASFDKLGPQELASAGGKSGVRPPPERLTITVRGLLTK
ncbi:MAG: hypothetical protein HYT39_02415 [Candidatus Sungbacteria bacterium]|nr:hypothetical protein [Candidatus Sungbacteria bacterium]